MPNRDVRYIAHGTYECYEDWATHAELSYVVYNRFMTWARDEYDLSNEDIYHHMNSGKLIELEKQYYAEIICGQQRLKL